MGAYHLQLDGLWHSVGHGHMPGLHRPSLGVIYHGFLDMIHVDESYFYSPNRSSR